MESEEKISNHPRNRLGFAVPLLLIVGSEYVANALNWDFINLKILQCTLLEAVVVSCLLSSLIAGLFGLVKVARASHWDDKVFFTWFAVGCFTALWAGFFYANNILFAFSVE